MGKLQKAEEFGKVCRKVQDAQLSSPEVQELIHNKNITFDLLMLEAQMTFILAFGWRFKCPIIGFTTMNPAMQYHYSLNNPVNPVANPNQNVLVEDHENLTFIERFRSFFYDEIYKLFFYYKILPGDHAIMKKYFGDDLPPLLEIQNNISMLFVGNNPIFYNNRPLNPNTITIGGGMHIGEAKPLPQVSRKIQ
ncbi:hypothetical protein JTB14_020156 [Gonioctena quinquepunctata]|nr:hypothetical protein JTB14_020156 [Gonioctena quinquepunctata]